MDATILMQNLLDRIFKEHSDSNGYTFSVDNNVETLTIPICGGFPKSKPDLLVKMHPGKKIHPVVNFEVCDS